MFVYMFVQNICVKDDRLLCLCCCGVVPPAVVFNKVGSLLHPTDYDSLCLCVCVYQCDSRFKLDFFVSPGCVFVFMWLCAACQVCVYSLRVCVSIISLSVIWHPQTHTN